MEEEKRHDQEREQKNEQATEQIIKKDSGQSGDDESGYTIKLCIGSSCHLKHTHEVAHFIYEYLTEHQDLPPVLFKYSFCMGDCENGVCVDFEYPDGGVRRLRHIRSGNISNALDQIFAELKQA